MRARSHDTCRTRTVLCIAVVGLALLAPAAAEDGEQDLSGSIEILYRNVSQDGSTEKYNEDFDGLESGARLGHLDLSWNSRDEGLFDYARLNLTGLGGDPYESSSLRLGRKNVWDLSARHTKQLYLYDLFELVSNEDGATWNTRRTKTDLDLRVFPTDDVQLFFRFHRGQRRGDSLFMKDVSRDVFRLETPLDQDVNYYTVGANFELGPLDIVFRQSLRRYDNQFDNHTEGNLGLDQSDMTVLNSYEWRQNDSGSADLTTLRLNAAPSKRVGVTVSLFGTFLGEETLDSNVVLDADGIDFTGAAFTIAGGTSTMKLEGDNLLVEADVSVQIIDALALHLQYQGLERELEGDLTRDLDADGTEDDIDGDGTPGTQTRLDYQLNTMTALLDYRPLRQVGLRAGLRQIDRELEREGFGGLRDLDWESEDDETVIFGVVLRPVEWFKLNADYEDGDITQPFNAVAPQETEHSRLRATFTPRDSMRVDLGYMDFDHTNLAPDFRSAGSFYQASQEGTTQSISFWHRANEDLDYLFRYAEEEFDSNVAVVIDRTFGPPPLTEDGDSIFSVDNTQFLAQINYRLFRKWRLDFRYLATESEGDNLLTGEVSAASNLEKIEQEYQDVELGVTYSFPSGLFVGGSLRAFDYEDKGTRTDTFNSLFFTNDRLDYDGEIFTVRAGFRF